MPDPKRPSTMPHWGRCPTCHRRHSYDEVAGQKVFRPHLSGSRTCSQPSSANGRCECGPGVWGSCDECGTDCIVHHRCEGGCDDVTCENRYVCRVCLGLSSCPLHHREEDDRD